MLKETENNVKIEGILSEIDLEAGSYTKNGQTIEKISGFIKVRVNQKINGEDVELDIPVYMFANKLKNNGQPNPAYVSIEHIMTEYVSIAAAGIEKADRVRITNGTIRMNEYYGQGDKLTSYPRINASFVNKVTDLTKFKPEASFSAVFMIGEMGYEHDVDGVEIEDRYKIRGILPQYGGSVDVVDFYAINPNVINVISNAWSPDDTVKIVGKLNFTSRVEEKSVEVDFGEPRVERHTVSVSELIITGGTEAPMSGDFALEVEDVQEALRARQARLAELKDKAKNKTANSHSAPSAKKSGFSDLGF